MSLLESTRKVFNSKTGDFYPEKAEVLRLAPKNSAVIDVGCKDGGWMGQMHSYIPTGVVRIGIDPINNGVLALTAGDNLPTYHHYFQTAIDNVDKLEKRELHIFDEPGCNSLLQASSYLTMRKEIKTELIYVTNLEEILKNLGIKQVYYLKCDCQGSDINVVKSARKYLKNMQYVLIEASFSREKPLYKNQSYVEDNVEEMKRLDFEVLYWMEYNPAILPEGEVLFRRKA